MLPSIPPEKNQKTNLESFIESFYPSFLSKKLMEKTSRVFNKIQEHKKSDCIYFFLKGSESKEPF